MRLCEVGWFGLTAVTHLAVARLASHAVVYLMKEALLGLVLVLLSGCRSDTTGEERTAGGGGVASESAAGQGGRLASQSDGGSSVGGDHCQEEDVACCDRSNLPCQDLDLEACSARDDCEVVWGTPYVPGDEGTWEDASWDDFLGCRSVCAGLAGDAISCAFDPAMPGECYVVPTTAAPDGWVVRFECSLEPGDCEIE